MKRHLLIGSVAVVALVMFIDVLRIEIPSALNEDIPTPDKEARDAKADTIVVSREVQAMLDVFESSDVTFSRRKKSIPKSVLDLRDENGRRIWSLGDYTELDKVSVGCVVFGDRPFRQMLHFTAVTDSCCVIVHTFGGNAVNTYVEFVRYKGGSERYHSVIGDRPEDRATVVEFLRTNPRIEHL